MTSSGYPFVVKRWARGTPLSSAKEVFRGKPSDVSAGPETLHDGQGHQVVLLSRGINFFENEVYLLTSHGTKRIAVPKKNQIEGLLNNRHFHTKRRLDAYRTVTVVQTRFGRRSGPRCGQAGIRFISNQPQSSPPPRPSLRRKYESLRAI